LYYKDYIVNREKLARSVFLIGGGGHRAIGTILVTNNTREFERIPRLRLENWAM